YNVGVGERTSLNELYAMIQTALADLGAEVKGEPIYGDFRAGDVRHSQADVEKAKRLLGYQPSFRVADGIQTAMPWYREFLEAV
ncbi:MAG: LPS biosynthesis protein WbpP, partial [Geminicoccaceae bacterium]